MILNNLEELIDRLFRLIWMIFLHLLFSAPSPRKGRLSELYTQLFQLV